MARSTRMVNRVSSPELEYGKSPMFRRCLYNDRGGWSTSEVPKKLVGRILANRDLETDLVENSPSQRSSI